MSQIISKPNKKRTAAVFAVLSIVVATLGISYAGINYSQHMSNGSEWSAINADVRTIEDFEEADNWGISDGPIKKEIRVANLGGAGYGSIYVRLQLKEYMEIGVMSAAYSDQRYIIDTNGDFVVFPTKEDALADWPGHNVEQLTDVASGVSGWFVESQQGDPNGQYGKHVTISFEDDMTHATKVLGDDSPPNAAQDAADKHHMAPNGECDYLSHDWKTPNAIEEYVLWYLGDHVYSLSGWLATPAPLQGGAFWVYDDLFSTGWVYWMQQLAPGQTSENLLEQVELIREPDGPHYYNIHTDMQAVSYSDLHRWTDMPDEIEAVFGRNLPPPNIIHKASFEGTYAPFDHSTNASDIYADPTAPDGDYSLRVTFEPGFPSGYAPDFAWVEMDSVEDLWVSFYFKVSANWEWHQVIQKLAYFSCGDPNLELTNHMLGIHYDVPTGGPVWEPMAIGYTLQFRNYPEPHIHWGGDQSLLSKNTWHKVELHMKVNSPGVHNGIGQIWLDGQLVLDANNIMWLDVDDPGGFYNFLLNPIFGGYGDPVQETMYLYYDDFIMQDGPFWKNP